MMLNHILPIFITELVSLQALCFVNVNINMMTH